MDNTKVYIKLACARMENDSSWQYNRTNSWRYITDATIKYISIDKTEHLFLLLTEIRLATNQNENG